MAPTLFLLDVFSLLFQVFHAIPTMTSPQGLPTNAVFGFTRDLFNILKTHQPTHWLCAMDSPGPGTRDVLYPEYKANRSEMPVDLRPQIELVGQVMDGFGAPSLQCLGWEADDVIATITRQAVERGFEVRILTNDKDARQLLGPHVQVFNIRKNTWLDEAGLKADWGIRPDQVIDYQSLVGDSVDNVPGVPLVGPKKATALLEQFGTLDHVLDNADKVAGDKLKANLKQYADLARLSRQLVTLNQHLPLEPDWDAMRIGRVDVARLSDLFREFGFRRFIDEVRSLPPEQIVFSFPSSSPASGEGGNETSSTSATPATKSSDGLLFPELDQQCELVDDDAKLADFINQLARQSEFCLDVAASSENATQAEILGFAFCWEEGHAWFVPTLEAGPLTPTLSPDAGEREQSLPHATATTVIDALRPILERPDIRLVNHDLKFDLILLRRAGIRATGLGVDPMVASYLLEAGARSHDLPALAEKFFQKQLLPAANVFGGKTGSANRAEDELANKSNKTVPTQTQAKLFADTAPTAPVADIDIEIDEKRLAKWATERADTAWRLSRLIGDELRREGLWDLYWNLERPLIDVLAEMELTGIRVDVAELQRQSADIGRRLHDLVAEIHRLAGHEFNIDSPKQLAKVLFNEQGLPVIKKLKTGPSTDQDVLEKLALVHPLPAKLIEHRQLSKLKGTYLDALPQMVNPLTGRIHASFHQVVAATGRLSSANPNLQNIPIRTAEGRRVRRAFVPSPSFHPLQMGGPGGVSDWKFVCADYSQIELRILAHFCGDPVLCEAFANGTDIHTAVASEIFNVGPAVVTAEQRRVAKAVNFGVLYGQSPFGLSETLGIDQVEAALFIDQYFVKYAGVDQYIALTLAEVARSGFVTTILGRRRAISGIRPERHRQLNLSERTAINTVIQGSAADLIKQAMIRVHHRLQNEQHPARLLLQIHDELVLETPAAEVVSLAKLVRDEMQSAMSLRVPLVVDVSSGNNWLELEDVR